MTTRLLRPEEAALRQLIAEIGRSPYCLVTVAYVDLPTAEVVAQAIEGRIKAKKRTSFRLLFRATDFFTDPRALRRLRAAGTASQVQLRYSSHPKFHAKAYGFRSTVKGKSVVVLGSANMTEGATAADSGELGVRLDRNALASEAWDVMEGFWELGRSVTPQWLRTYEQRFDMLEAKRAAARKAQVKWGRTRTKRRTLPKPNLETQAIFVHAIPPTPRAIEAAVDDAAESAGLQLPGNWYRFDRKKDALRLPRDRPLVELFQTMSRDRIRSIAIVHVGRPFVLVDVSDNTRHWIVPCVPARGATLRLPQAKAAQYEKKLAKLGLSWSKLSSMNGYLKKRRSLFLKAMKVLGWK